MKRMICLLLVWLTALTGLALAEVGLPEGLKAIVLPPEAKVVAAITQNNGEMATLEAPGAPKQIKEFYKEQLPKAGWKLDMEMEQAELAILSCAKDQLKLVLAASKKSDAVVAFTLTLSKD